jgi:hypothetical protein
MDNECSRPAGKPQDSSRDAATRPARKLLDTTGWKDCHQTIKFVKKIRKLRPEIGLVVVVVIVVTVA